MSEMSRRQLFQILREKPSDGDVEKPLEAAMQEAFKDGLRPIPKHQTNAFLAKLKNKRDAR